MFRYLHRVAAPIVSGSSIRSMRGRKGTISDADLFLFLIRTRHPGVTYCRLNYWRKVLHEGDSSGKIFRPHRNCQVVSFSTKCQTVEKANSVKHVLERYNAFLEDGDFKPECFVDFTSSLCSAVYSNLAHLPWLHCENFVKSFAQILVNRRTRELLTEPLWSYPQFQNLYDHIQLNVGKVPGKDCPSILLSLIYSGMDKKDPLSRKLLWRCYDAAPNLDIKQLQDCTNILQCLANRDYVFAQKLVSRLDDLFQDNDNNVHFQIKDLCKLNPVLAQYMSQRLLEKCATALLDRMQEEHTNMDIHTVGYCLRYAKSMKFSINPKILNKMTTTAMLILDHHEHFDHIQSFEVAEICRNAARFGCYSGNLVKKMQARSLEILRDTSGCLHVRDLTNLLFAFRKDTSPPIKQELTELLIKHMPDTEVMTLSIIANHMLELDLRDPELVTAFQKKVLHNFDSISIFSSRLLKVLRLLRDRLEYDSHFNQHICESLLKLLYDSHGYDPIYVLVSAQFILPNVRTIVPAILMDCLLNVISRCSMRHTLLILKEVEQMNQPWSKALHNQVLQIQLHAQQNVERKLETTVRAGHLALLIKDVYIDSQNKDFAQLDRIMDRFPRLTKSMTHQDFMRTVRTFKRFSQPYYTPEVFEDLIAYAKQNFSPHSVTFLGILELLVVLSRAAYRPEDFESFSSFVLEVLEKRMEIKNHVGQILMIYFLSQMQIFDDGILNRVFSFEYLEEMDTVIKAASQYNAETLRKLMMKLNRSVVLECPHINVPWFHEEYCQKLVQASSLKVLPKNSVFMEEVIAALEEVTAGPNFIKNGLSPYFHKIDFEVVLDSKGNPVNRGSIPADELGLQRVAVMLISMGRLCTNSHRRKGQYLTYRRHLEILGYRVAEIPRYDWNSIALSDWAAKVNFVQEKVFKTSDKDVIPSLSDSAFLSDSRRTMHPYWK